MGCQALLQGVFQAQGSNRRPFHPLHWQVESLAPAPPGKLHPSVLPDPFSLGRIYTQASLMAQTVKNLPAKQETRIRSLFLEDPLEEGMAKTPVFLPRESHGQRSLAGYSPWGRKESYTEHAFIYPKL